MVIGTFFNQTTRRLAKIKNNQGESADFPCSYRLNFEEGEKYKLMNNMSTEIKESCGVVLTDNVNLQWLNKLTPRYHDNFVKFVVNTETNKVAVGMDIHADAKRILGNDDTVLYGGNIYTDGHIEYQSTLNVEKVLSLQKNQSILRKLFRKNNKEFNPRIITDREMIDNINAVLKAWIKVK